MKGYTIQHSINLLEDSVEDLEARPSGGGTAADVSYDNTSSHMTADDVQEAIDELNTAIGQIDTLEHISSTPVKIGTINGQDLYRVVLSGTMDANSKSVTFSSSNLIQTISGGVSDADGAKFLGMWYRGSQTTDIVQAYPDAETADTLVIRNGYYASRPNYKVIIDYVVAAPVESNTRKKSSK